jgi:methionyl-tRNA formyltransferase
MKCAFVTSVQLGLSCMEEIYQVGGKLECVITLKDNLARSKSGRVYVDDFCNQHNIEIVKIRKVNDSEAIEAIQRHEIDWLFIIGWSQIAQREVLQAPKRGVLGMHPTLLPQGRGRAAIPWAIIKGLDKTGVTMFQLDEGVDTGPIVAQEVLPIAPDETATSLYHRVNEAHRKLMRRVWPDLVADRLVFQQQDESQATEWTGRTPEDGGIIQAMDCVSVDRLVRATTHPYPGAFLDYEGTRYRIWCGRAHPGLSLDAAFRIDDAQGRLWISLHDGCYEATEWETHNPDNWSH